MSFIDFNCCLHFRKKPAHQRVLELGMPESSRKFISCVRKYLIFYLTLCEETEDLCTLERAHTCLKTDRKVSYFVSLHSLLCFKIFHIVLMYNALLLSMIWHALLNSRLLLAFCITHTPSLPDSLFPWIAVFSVLGGYLSRGTGKIHFGPGTCNLPSRLWRTFFSDALTPSSGENVQLVHGLRDLLVWFCRFKFGRSRNHEFARSCRKCHI